MSNWWNSTGASNLTRGLSSITGQLSSNLKEILTEASEEHYDPTAELTRARQQIEDLELRKQTLIDECSSLRKQCDELIMQKQAGEIKSDMLLAECRRTIEEKDNEIKRLRENTNAVSWNNVNDLSNTWTDILEDDQSEISEYMKYQRTIRELKEENIHLRDEMANLRKSMKKQSRHDDEKFQMEQIHAEQMTKYRQEYDNQIEKLQLRIQELEQLNTNLQADELRKSMEVQKEVDDVDKDLLSEELEQANKKLNWYNEKFKEYSDLQIHIDLYKNENEQLKKDLEIQQEINQSNLQHFDQYEKAIGQLQEQLEQFNTLEQQQQQMKNENEEFNRLLIEERQRCDALGNDNDSICRLLEETRGHNLEIEQNLHKKIEEFNSQIIHLEEQLKIEINQRNLLDETIKTLHNEIQIKNEQIQKQLDNEEHHQKEIHIREMLEKQLIELNEDLQTLENDKIQLHEQIDDLKEQLRLKDRHIQTIENSMITPGSPSNLSSSPDIRGRSPSPQTFEHLLELEAQILRYEQQIRELHSIYERFVTLLPIEISSSEQNQLSLVDLFRNLFEQWSTYVDTLTITQQELDSVKQLLIEKQDDLEKLQADLDLTTTKLIELQQEQPVLIHQNKFLSDDNEEEIENILELHPFPPRAPSRQSLISSTPGEKQQLIAQNELLSSLLAEKDRELISLQQAEKTREDLIRNFETLKLNLQQMERDQEIKQTELNDIRNVLDEKLRENSSLKKEKMYFIEKLADMERDRQENQSIIQITRKHSTQDEDKPSTPIIKEDHQFQFDQNQTKEQYDKLRNEYDQLVEFSKRQHDESNTYYNEYTRILGLYNELKNKSSQLQIDYESLQSLIQQKNEAYLQCQNELNNYQNLLYHEKKKSEEIDLLRSTLIERDMKIQQLVDNETTLLVKQSDLERDLKLLEQSNFELKSAEQTFLEQLQQTNIEQTNLELKRSVHERDLAIVEKKQMENELDFYRQKSNQFEERERKLTNELERLRAHLLTMEESYTNDLIAAEDREKSLRNQIAQLEDAKHAQNELIQQLNTSGEQSKQTLATELGTLKYEYSKLETLNNNLNNQLQYQMKCSQNLQNVLEQFKREREQHINEHLRQYQDSLREQIEIVSRLTNENNEIRSRLVEYNEALSAAHRLTDQMEKKDQLIYTLRHDIQEKDQQIQRYEINLRDLQSTSGSRVEKQLVKNILLSYFHTPVDKRQEVIPLLGALVGFTQEEYKKAVDSLSNNNSNSSRTGWLSGWLGGSPTSGGGGGTAAQLARTRTQSETPVYDPNKSFTELLIQYVDQQSMNNPQTPAVKFNTDEYLQRHDNILGGGGGGGHLLRKPSLSASANPFVNTTHVSLVRQPPPVVLSNQNTQLNPPSIPSSTATTTTNSESSSTILKDLLKA